MARVRRTAQQLTGTKGKGAASTVKPNPAGSAAAKRARSKAKQQQGVTKGLIARYPGLCSLCGTRYDRGARIASWSATYVHLPCKEATQAKGAILRGETFAGHKVSDWSLRGRRRD